MINAKDVRKGMMINHNGRLCVVVGVEHIAPGNWRAINQIKFRDVETGSTAEVRFSTSDRLEDAYVELHDMEYLYAEADSLVLMNQESYEQIHITKEIIGEDFKFLKENMVLKISFYNGKPVSIQIPNIVELRIVETEPSLKGATVTNVYKPAKLETGAIVDVPPFINTGEVIRIDTRDGKYVERVAQK